MNTENIQIEYLDVIRRLNPVLKKIQNLDQREKLVVVAQNLPVLISYGTIFSHIMEAFGYEVYNKRADEISRTWKNIEENRDTLKSESEKIYSILDDMVQISDQLMREKEGKQRICTCCERRVYYLPLSSYYEQHSKQYGEKKHISETLNHEEYMCPCCKIDFPVVVKPVDANSSKGVSKVLDDKAFERAMKEAQEISRTGEIIAEEYIDGEEYSVDVFVQGGNPCILLITRTIKGFPSENHFIITQSIFEYEVFQQFKSKIKRVVEEICNTFEIKEGPMIVQLLIQKNNIYVIEFSFRTAGGSKVPFIKRLTGIDVLELLLDVIENTSQKIFPEISKEFASMNYVYDTGEIHEKICNLEKIKSKGVIEEYFIYKNEMSEGKNPKCSTDRIWGFLICADTEEERMRKEKETNEEFEKTLPNVSTFL